MRLILSLLRWLCLAPLDLLLSALAWPLAPVIVLATRAGGRAPRWAWPWLTHDNPIDGDAGHWARWPDNGTRRRRFARRVAWLWRNRGYGWSYRISGVVLSGRTHTWGPRRVSDQPLCAGWCWAYCPAALAWQLYGFVPWWPSARRGLRVRLGWKIPLTVDHPQERVMLVTHVNPVKGYTQGGPHG